MAYNIHSVAEAFLDETLLDKNVQSIEEKIKTYISNCMEALGVKLQDFIDKKGINSYVITEELKNHIIDTLEASVDENDKVVIRNKRKLKDDIWDAPFGYGKRTGDVVFVTKQFVKANFEDSTYESLKEVLRENIKQLEEDRNCLLKDINNMGNLTDGLFLITLNKNIFDAEEMKRYFQLVRQTYKEYDIQDDGTRLNEKDMILLDFLSLRGKLKVIKKQYQTEIIKKMLSN